MKNLQKLSENTSQLIRKKDYYETSIYEGELTTKCIIENTAKLKKSFPALSKEFFDVFADRIKENNFNDNRLKDAINFVIDTCVYPNPNIAQFISFDKNIKLYNYYDIIKMNDITGIAFKNYRPIKYGNFKKPLYASIQDIEKYKLKPFKK